MRINLHATRRVWRQTVWATAIVIVWIIAMMVYTLSQATPDYAALRLLVQFLLLAPLMLGIAYVIKRFIERLADQ